MFVGDEALRKAREVATLVAALSALDVPPERVQVVDVRVGSDGFLGLKSSSCRYTIRIRELPAARIAQVVATVASHKGAELSSLRWIFAELDQLTAELRERCLSRSRSTALSTAKALGLTIAGVYRHRETLQRPDGSQALPARKSDLIMKAAVRGRGGDDGSWPSLSFTGRLILSLETQYRVVVSDASNE